MAARASSWRLSMPQVAAVTSCDQWYSGMLIFLAICSAVSYSQNPLMIYLHSSPAQLRTDPSVAVAAAMFDGNLLNRRPHFHLFLDRPLFSQGPVEAGSADSGQFTHPLDTQAALQGHHFADLLVDAVSPESPRFWRRASTMARIDVRCTTAAGVSLSTSRK